MKILNILLIFYAIIFSTEACAIKCIQLRGRLACYQTCIQQRYQSLYSSYRPMIVWKRFMPSQLFKKRFLTSPHTRKHCITAGEYLDLEPINRCLVMKYKALCRGAFNKMLHDEIATTFGTFSTDC